MAISHQNGKGKGKKNKRKQRKEERRKKAQEREDRIKEARRAKRKAQKLRKWAIKQQEEKVENALDTESESSSDEDDPRIEIDPEAAKLYSNYDWNHRVTMNHQKKKTHKT